MVADGFPLRRWGHLADWTVLSGAQNQIDPATGRLSSVAGLVGDDLEQPGTKRRAGPKTSQRIVRLDEGILCNIVGLGGVAGDQVGGAKGNLLSASHERLVGEGVAPLRPGDELTVFRWPALQGEALQSSYNRRPFLVPDPFQLERLIASHSAATRQPDQLSTRHVSGADSL